MAGRLGMTGDSLTRGDKDVMKVDLTPEAKWIRHAKRQERLGFGLAGATVAGAAALAGEAHGRKKGIRYGERAGIRETQNPDKYMQEYVRGVQNSVHKLDTTMSDDDAKKLVAVHGTQGRLPKELDRDTRMKAYEARYIAAGGKKSEKWNRRADAAEITRNVGLAGATTAAAGMLAAKSPRLARRMKDAKGLRHINPSRAEGAALAAGTVGGASELAGEYARKKRASYQNSPGGVAASALHRMQGYNPEATP